MDAGMRVEYEDLDGCEAMLIGVGNRAIVTIKPSASRGRERYSIGHELGHWEMHRGKSFRCRVDDPDRNFAGDRGLEKEADSYSAGLLIPLYMFGPAVTARSDLGFPQLEELAIVFDTSVLATSMLTGGHGLVTRPSRVLFGVGFAVAKACDANSAALVSSCSPR
jgi:hypothetical protein